MLPFSVPQFNQFLVHRHPPRDRHRTPHRTLRLGFHSSRYPLQLSDFQLLHSNLQQAKKKPWPPWRLIATHPKLEIAGTRSKRRRSHFLIATKNAVHPLHNNLRPCGESARGRGSQTTIHNSRVTASLIVANSPGEWPSRTERVRMDARLLLLKLLLGDTSGLQDRACSLFYLAGPK